MSWPETEEIASQPQRPKFLGNHDYCVEHSYQRLTKLLLITLRTQSKQPFLILKMSALALKLSCKEPLSLVGVPPSCLMPTIGFPPFGPRTSELDFPATVATGVQSHLTMTTKSCGLPSGSIPWHGLYPAQIASALLVNCEVSSGNPLNSRLRWLPHCHASQVVSHL